MSQHVKHIIIDEVPNQGLMFPKGIREKMVDCMFPSQEIDHLYPHLRTLLIYNNKGRTKYYFVTKGDLLKSLENNGRHGDAVEVSNWFKTKQCHGVVFSGDCCRLLD